MEFDNEKHAIKDTLLVYSGGSGNCLELFFGENSTSAWYLPKRAMINIYVK